MQNKIRKFFTNLVGMGLISFLVFPSIPAIQQFNNPSTIKNSKDFYSDSVVAIYKIPKTKNSESEIIALIYYWANFYGINVYEFYETANCESEFNILAKGDNETSFGIFQIHLPAHPEITKEQALDYEWAIKWSAKQFSKGNASLWTCWRDLFEH